MSSLEYMRQWRAKNSERIKEYKRNWNAANPDAVKKWKRKSYLATIERCKDRMRKWRANNPERCRELSRRKRAENPELYRNSNRKWMRKAYKTRGDEIRAFSNRWKRNNPDKVLEANYRYRTRKISAGTEDCSERIRELLTCELCFWCKEKMKSITIDHVVPLSRGGRHEPENLVAACPRCNCSRGNRLVSEWQHIGADLTEFAWI